MRRNDFPDTPRYHRFTSSEGIEYKEGDIVTCYYAGFYKIVGFWDYDSAHLVVIPQVIVDQVYDANGKKKSGRKSCMADSMKQALPEITKDIERIERESKQKIESLTKLKELLTQGK